MQDATEPQEQSAAPEPPRPTPGQAVSDLMQIAIDASAGTPVPVCAACGRERTLADDYDYTPMQLVTGRALGWFNGDGEQMCGGCLALTMRGQLP